MLGKALHRECAKEGRTLLTGDIREGFPVELAFGAGLEGVSLVGIGREGCSRARELPDQLVKAWKYWACNREREGSRGVRGGRTWVEARLFRPDLRSLRCSAEGLCLNIREVGSKASFLMMEVLVQIFPVVPVLDLWGSSFLRLLL